MKIQFSGKPVHEDGKYQVISARGEDRINRENSADHTSRVNQLLRAISCPIISPKEFISVAGETGFRMVRTGFRLNIPEGSLIRWCRYKVCISPAVPNSQPLQVQSFHPVRILEKTVFLENFFITGGQIESAINPDVDDSTYLFDKYVLGYKSGNHINWDFFPSGSLVSDATDHLLIAISTQDKATLTVKSSVCFTIYHPEFGEKYYETREEIRGVD